MEIELRRMQLQKMRAAETQGRDTTSEDSCTGPDLHASETGGKRNVACVFIIFIQGGNFKVCLQIFWQTIRDGIFHAVIKD